MTISEQRYNCHCRRQHRDITKLSTLNSLKPEFGSSILPERNGSLRILEYT